MKTLCGCAKHYVRIGTNTVIWEGMYWSAMCAFDQLQKKYEAASTDLNDLRKFRSKVDKAFVRIGKLPCVNCGKEVGRSFRFFGDAVYCNVCNQELGGES